MGKPKKKFIRPLGLITNPSKLLKVGGLANAANTIIRRPGILESRRGFEYLAKTATGQHRALFPYENSLVGAFGTTELSKLSAPSWTAFTGSFTDVSTPNFSTRLRMLNGNQNLLALTGGGVYRLSGLAEQPIRAGAPRGLCFDRTGPTNVLTGTGGILADQFQFAYRGVVGIKDAKGITHFGEPSSRTVIANATFTSGWVTTVAKNVVLRLILAKEATVNHFFQIYRSKAVPLGTQPGDDLQLVYQDYLTSKNITDGYVEITDVYSDALPKGAYIHTSPNFAKAFGLIDGENGPPPIGADGCVFKDRLFLFNTVGYPTFNLRLLGVALTNGVQTGDQLVLQLGGFTMTAGTNYNLVTTGTAFQNIEATALNLVEGINKHASNTSVYAFYVSAPDDAPGKILLMSRTPGQSIGTVFVGPTSTRTCWDPVLIPNGNTMILTRAGSTVTATTTLTKHVFRVGEQVLVTPPNGSWGAGPFVVLTATATTITYTDATSGAAGPTAATSVILTGYNTEAWKFKDDIASNGFSYSKIGDLESFPLRNKGLIQESSVRIGRAIALKDSVVVWTFDGLYRLTGDDPDTFTVTLIDQTAKLIATEAVAKIGDSAIGWTTKGVIQVDDSGWRVISDDVKPTLDQIQLNVSASTLFAKSFAIGYDTDQVFELWYPGVNGCSNALVWSAATNTWTEYWDALDYTAGVYDPYLDRVWYGGYFDASNAFTFKERKAGGLVFQDDRITSASGPTVIQVAISKYVSFNPFAGADSSALKTWEEVLFSFEDTAPSVFESVVLYNERGLPDDVLVALMPSDSTEPWLRIWPSFNCSGARFGVTLTVSVINEAYKFLGFEVQWSEFGMSGLVR